MHRVAVKKAFSLIAVVGMTTAVAACGSSSSTRSTASTAQSTGSATASSGGTAAAVAAAQKAVAPFIGKPAAFPVTEKLNKSVKGKTVDYMSSGTPIDSLLFQLTVPAAKILGLNLHEIKAGTSAATVSAAFATAVSQKPAAVMVPGLDPALYATQLKALQAAKIHVDASALVDGAKYGLTTVQGGPADDARAGMLMANYVVGHMVPKANAKIVVYSVPEVPAIGAVAAAFTAELKRICPACQSRTVQIPAATLGSTAPNAVVSDLQSHAGTDVAVFADDEVELGLPQALKTAGITIKTLGYAPGPTNLQYLKNGQETAALADDLAVSAWTDVDQVAREIGGQPLAGPEAQGFGVQQFLTPKDITFNFSHGWSGYPDFAQRFAKLWGGAK